MAAYEQTLCWQCQNTNRHKCPWFDPDNPQPVPGWVAEPRTMYRGQQTYLVRECPKFDPMPPRKAVPTRTSLPGVPRKKPVKNVFRGVHRGVRHWVARINHKGQSYYLGYFKSFEKAVAARLAAEEAIARGEEPCKQ